MTDEQPVLVAIAHGVATVTLNRPQAMNALSRALMTALALPVVSVQAQSVSSPAPHAAHAAAALHQVLHLSALAQTDVPQDWLVISLSVQKEGLQAPAVQKQLNAVLSAALAVASLAITATVMPSDQGSIS